MVLARLQVSRRPDLGKELLYTGCSGLAAPCLGSSSRGSQQRLALNRHVHCTTNRKHALTKAPGYRRCASTGIGSGATSVAGTSAAACDPSSAGAADAAQQARE